MEQRSFITKQKKLIRELRKIDPEMGIQTFLALLEIAENPRCSVMELARNMGTTGASASRNVSLLSRWKKHGLKGMDLVEATYDAHDRRIKVLQLTPAGEALIKKLAGGFK